MTWEPKTQNLMGKARQKIDQHIITKIEKGPPSPASRQTGREKWSPISDSSNQDTIIKVSN